LQIQWRELAREVQNVRKQSTADDHDEHFQHAVIVAVLSPKFNSDEFWRASAALKPKGIAVEPWIEIRIGRKAPREAVAKLDVKQAGELAGHLLAAAKSLRTNRKRVKREAREMGKPSN
jgi:hypothetical protein